MKAHYNFGAFVEASPVMSEWSEKYEQTAAEVKGQLQETCGAHIVPFRGENIHFIGSCAVRGMYGKALLDFAIVTRDLLPDIPDAIVKQMEAKGWLFCGCAAIALGSSNPAGGKSVDQWFVREETADYPACTMHCLSVEEAEETLSGLIAMRDYLRHSEDARRRYSDAKRQPKDVDVLQYSMNKAKVASQIHLEAAEWAGISKAPKSEATTQVTIKCDSIRDSNQKNYGAVNQA